MFYENVMLYALSLIDAEETKLQQVRKVKGLQSSWKV